MTNSQEHITTELKKSLEEMIILPSKTLTNLIFIIIGIIAAKSVTLSNIAMELKDVFSKGTETSKIKRKYRFFTNKNFDAGTVYYFFASKLIEKYANTTKNKKQYIIFDHTTIKDKFTIWMFSLKVGKRAILLWYQVFDYNDKNNKDFNHVKQGLHEIHSIFKRYNFEVIVLADRGFKSVGLFRFIDEKLKWKYCIRCTKDVTFSTEKGSKAEGKEDVWYIINNLEENSAIKGYKKRFDIEEMFNDMKSGGFNLEDTWGRDLIYCKNLMLCICIAYTWIIILGVSCSKDKKNNLFKVGLKWFARAYNENVLRYYLKFDFLLYQS